MITGNEFIDLPIFILIIIGIIFIVSKKVNNIWERRAYTDDFGRATKNFFVSQKKKQSGFFSNSATSFSSMDYYTFIDKDEISFRFWDYGNYQLKNAYSEHEYYDFKCLAPSGERFEATAVMYGGTSELVIDDKKEVADFIKFFQSNKSIRVIVSRGLREYKFTMKKGNFDKVFNSRAK